ncbi:hypothetical protein [Aquimarina aggregata]|uniref:hypothetical protein n=1 Tax=Aquimarina aggregata TaxID=1642818 RepID=UPI0024938D28|nr:hypothetical protein [Aquimarina aggregata]
MLLSKALASSHLLVLCIALCTISTIYSQKAVRVDQYIKVERKNSKRFEVFNISRVRLGIIFSHEPSKIIYLNPYKSKSFPYKDYPITSEISLNYTKKEWDRQSVYLNTEIGKLALWHELYQLGGSVDDAMHNLEKLSAQKNAQSKKEFERKDQQYKAGKNLIKASFKEKEINLIKRIRYYGYLYRASIGSDGRYFIPLKLSTALSSY